MKSSRSLILILLVVGTWVFVHQIYSSEQVPEITREFGSWVEVVEEQYRTDRLPDDVTVRVTMQLSDLEESWELSSTGLVTRPVEESVSDEQELLVRVLRLMKESNLIGPFRDTQPDEFVEIEAYSTDQSFRAVVPLAEIRNNVRAMNLLVLLKNRTS